MDASPLPHQVTQFHKQEHQQTWRENVVTAGVACVWGGRDMSVSGRGLSLIGRGLL